MCETLVKLSKRLPLGTLKSENFVFIYGTF